MLLAIELEEEANLGLAQVEAGDEETVLVVHDVLTGELAHFRHVPRQLHPEGLEKAFGRRSAGRPQGENSANANCARDAGTAEGG